MSNDGVTLFEVEKTMTLDEKIAFMDGLNDGIASYLINLFTKWEDDKDTLPKDQHGNPKTVSKQAWLRRNDDRQYITITHKFGTYYLFGTFFKCMTTTCPTTDYGYDMVYTDKHVAHQWFHDFLKQLHRAEREYFKEHDPVSIKIKHLKDVGNFYRTVFDNDLLNDIVWNGETNVDESTLDLFIDAYNKLDKAVQTATNELNQQLASQIKP